MQPNRDRGEARASDGALPESYRMPGWLKEAEASADAEGMVRRVIWGTALVLGLCGAALWAGRRWLIGPHVAGAAPVEKMRVLGSLRLGGRAWVYWIQVGEQQALAGVDGTGIKTLTPLPSSFDGALAQFQRDEAGETPTGAAVAMTNNPTTLRSDHSPATTELRHG